MIRGMKHLSCEERAKELGCTQLAPLVPQQVYHLMSVPSASLLMTKNWEWWIYQKAVPLFREAWTGWRVERRET